MDLTFFFEKGLSPNIVAKTPTVTRVISGFLFFSGNASHPCLSGQSLDEHLNDYRLLVGTTAVHRQILLHFFVGVPGLPPPSLPPLAGKPGPDIFFFSPVRSDAIAISGTFIHAHRS